MNAESSRHGAAHGQQTRPVGLPVSSLLAGKDPGLALVQPVSTIYYNGIPAAAQPTPNAAHYPGTEQYELAVRQCYQWLTRSHPRHFVESVARLALQDATMSEASGRVPQGNVQPGSAPGPASRKRARRNNIAEEEEEDSEDSEDIEDREDNVQGGEAARTAQRAGSARQARMLENLNAKMDDILSKVSPLEDQIDKSHEKTMKQLATHRLAASQDTAFLQAMMVFERLANDIRKKKEEEGDEDEEEEELDELVDEHSEWNEKLLGLDWERTLERTKLIKTL